MRAQEPTPASLSLIVALERCWGMVLSLYREDAGAWAWL